jgi:hypothetical protein
LDPFYGCNLCASGYNDVSRNGIDGDDLRNVEKDPKNLKILEKSKVVFFSSLLHLHEMIAIKYPKLKRHIKKIETDV